MAFPFVHPTRFMTACTCAVMSLVYSVSATTVDRFQSEEYEVRGRALVLRSALPDANVPALSASWQATCGITGLKASLVNFAVSVKMADTMFAPCGTVTSRKRAPRVPCTLGSWPTSREVSVRSLAWTEASRLAIERSSELAST